jgi:hypothetical protein
MLVRCAWLAFSFPAHDSIARLKINFLAYPRIRVIHRCQKSSSAGREIIVAKVELGNDNC